MSSFNKANVTASLKKLLDTQDLNVVTEKKLRRLIEKELKYDDLTLDQEDGKKFVKQEVVRLLAEKEKIKSEAEDSVDSASVAFSSPKPKVKPAPKKSASTPKSKNQKAVSKDKADEVEVSESESLPKSTKRQAAKNVKASPRKLKQNSDSEEQVSNKSSEDEKEMSLKKKSESQSPPEKVPAKVKKDQKSKSTPFKKTVKRELSESDTEEAASKTASQKKTSQIKRPRSATPDIDSIQNSDQDNGDEKKSTLKKKTSAKKKATKAKVGVQFSDKALNKIKQLKSYILKCGTRKNWKSVLADLGPRQQINTLTSILEELGMKGRPTIEKCKVIARQQELKRETESLDLSNIITGERCPRRTRPSINYSKYDAPSPVESDIDVQASEKDSQASSEDDSESEDEWEKDNSSGTEAPTRKRRTQNIISESEDEEIDNASPKKDSSDGVHLSDSGSKLSASDNETKDEEHALSTKSLKCANLQLPKEDSSSANSKPSESIPLTDNAKAIPSADTSEPNVASPKVSSQTSSQNLDVLKSPNITESHKTDSPTSQPKSSNLSPIKQITPPIETSQKKSLDALMFSDSD
ncbi:hypothetical protein DSO57_1009129 [Entomophthora muscae]|uniref:Uncharacterized protein n=1 Tax=Entomophthora muscae TaxID=34485 RepID=A0ACC2TUN6_9FUNG|nr:hypothetical protein DSO57_1009129 [Entomophthora muscae]